MLKMKFWFEGNQLQPDCNIHGGCKIGSSACHACPHCVKVNSRDREVLWIGDKFVTKQIDSDINAEIVLKMQSLPDSAKELINKTHREDIHYRNQCLMIVQDTETSVATNYVPDWNDMFVKDWMVL